MHTRSLLLTYQVSFTGLFYLQPSSMREDMCTEINTYARASARTHKDKHA
jgi:hypothetical protein